MPSYCIKQPEGGIGLSPENQKLIDEGYGKWGKPVNAVLFKQNGGTNFQLMYLFHYYPISGEPLDEEAAEIYKKKWNKVMR